LVGPEFLGATELRVGGELQLVVNLCVVKAFLVLYVSSV
jgi:hypothetical protein